jgi:hypothetical protein
LQNNQRRAENEEIFNDDDEEGGTTTATKKQKDKLFNEMRETRTGFRAKTGGAPIAGGKNGNFKAEGGL